MTMLEARNVGDSYRDATGGTSTVVHLGPDRMVIRRQNGRFPTFAVYSGDRARLVASCVRSLAEAVTL